VIEESRRGFGQDNAKEPSLPRYYPTDSRFTDDEVRYQGCPTVAVTRGGRIFVGWYGGGVREPSLEHFNIVRYSDDDGKSFSSPLLVIESDTERMVHALDIQLWTAPNGALWLFWVQNNATPLTDDKEYMMTANTVDKLPVVKADGYIFPDMRHTCWCIVCDDPDAEKPVFSSPRLLDIGFLRCKPLVLDDGRWLLFNYDQLTDTYGYSISDDAGASFTRHYGAKKLPTAFDEGMAYQRRDGVIRLFVRNWSKQIGECRSTDDGLTFSEATLNGIASPDTRFYIGRTPSGRILLVNNDSCEGRTRMSVWLSDDDGATFPHRKVLDDPSYETSYPDVDFYDGKIYLVFDRERTGEKEIRLCVFTEAQILDKTAALCSKIISKP
jgi:hypothetical protein